MPITQDGPSWDTVFQSLFWIGHPTPRLHPTIIRVDRLFVVEFVSRCINTSII